MGILRRRKILSESSVTGKAPRRFRIQRYSPWRRRVILALGLVSLFSICWFFYWLGAELSGYKNDQIVWELNVLRLKVAQLEDQRSQLLRQLALLQQSSDVEFKAYKEVKQSLSDMQTRMLELDEELSLYKSIVSTSELQRGLHLQDVRVIKAGEEGGFLYKLVLAQVRGNGRKAQGGVEIKIKGKQKGVTATYSLNDLSPQYLGDMSFSFKYFQRIEGKLSIPKGFLPISLEIEIKPKGKRLKIIQRSYSWKNVLVGGV